MSAKVQYVAPAPVHIACNYAPFTLENWSGREDSNLRPLPPEGTAPHSRVVLSGDFQRERSSNGARTMQHSFVPEVHDEPGALSILLRGGKFYHGPDSMVAPHLPVGSPEREALFRELRKTFAEDWAAAEGAVEAARREKLGNLYFVTAGDAVKIGRTTNMSIRLRHIQAHNHEQVECVAFLEGEGWRERDYHRRFKAHRIRGEWFARVPEIEAEIERLTRPLTMEE